jgi:hypothetical protein
MAETLRRLEVTVPRRLDLNISKEGRPKAWGREVNKTQLLSMCSWRYESCRDG